MNHDGKHEEISAPEPSTALQNLAEFRYQLRRFMNFSEMASERAGIAAQQYQLMQVIAAMAEGQGASISSLAERMVLRHNSTVELVDRAERAGLVRRETDPSDMRRSLVTLTAEGGAILRKLVEEHRKELAPICGTLIEALRALQGVVDTVEPQDGPGVST